MVWKRPHRDGVEETLTWRLQSVEDFVMTRTEFTLIHFPVKESSIALYSSEDKKEEIRENREKRYNWDIIYTHIIYTSN